MKFAILTYYKTYRNIVKYFDYFTRNILFYVEI